MPQEKRAVALGFFDGIHIGHAALLRRLAETCAETGLISTVISFDTMPQNYINKQTVPLINTPEDRAWLITEKFRVHDIYLLPFDENTASMTWKEFIGMLINKYNAQHIIAGSNFRFGKKAEGTAELLRQNCRETGLGCDIINDVTQGGRIVSSTYIRELLLAGNIERANAFLGHPHIFTGIVSEGKKLGSKLGAPTINMRFPPDVLVPAYGVYATKVYPDGLTGVTNIGIRPTVDDSKLVTIETHIPGFCKNLYGYKVRIEFHKYLRPETNFENIDALKAQIMKDCEEAIEYFKSLKSLK